MTHVESPWMNGMEAEDSENSQASSAHSKLPTNGDDQSKSSKPPLAPLKCDPNSDSEAGGQDSQLSPSLRRSTRACALKAQEKLKFKEGMVDASHATENGHTATELPVQTTAAEVDSLESPKKKKRKLSTGSDMDQYDCKFGIRLDTDGDAVQMTDESEISSLTEEEISDLREKYEEIKNQEGCPTEEIKRARELQICELESELKVEEAKLVMMKKIRTNQQITSRNNLDATRRLAAGIASNSSGVAYKPPVASPQLNKLNGAVKNARSPAKPLRPNATPNMQFTPQQQQLIQTLIDKGAQIRPEQMSMLLQAFSNPAMSMLFGKQRDSQSQAQNQQQQERERRLRQEREEAQRKAAAEEAARLEAARARENAQTTQQKISAARNQLRRHLEQQLLQLPPPKVHTPDLSFIPNANQPDFCYLLGLDLVVQRNLKDKSVFKKAEVDPYVCEECGTDFTPAWQVIAGDKGDLHVYCEQCIRHAQKRKARHDRSVLYKRAFQKIAEQEKEFERQVTAGKFSEIIGTSASTSKETKESTSTAPTTTSATSTSASTAAKNSFNAAISSFASAISNSTSKAHAASSLAALAGLAPNSSSSSNSTSNSNRNLQANIRSMAAAASAASSKPDLSKKTTPTIPPNRKRPAPSSSSSSSASNSQAALLAAFSQNPAMLSQLQNQMAAASLRNPMIAAAMMNPQMMQQLYAQMSRLGGGGVPTSTATSTASSSANNAGMAALLAAAAQSQNPTSSASSNAASSLLSPLLSNPQLLRSLGGNTNFLQQMQQLAASAARKK